MDEHASVEPVSVGRCGVVPDGSEARDLLAIARLQAAYADVITRRAFAELEELFVAGCPVTVDTVTRDAMSFVGSEAFGRFVASAVGRFDFFEFVVLNAVVDVTGSGARGRMFMCEHRHDASVPANDGWSTAYGRYLDTYERIDGRWWFASRSYRSLARTGADGAILPSPDDDSHRP